MTRSTENRKRRAIVRLFKLKSSTPVRKAEGCRIDRLMFNCGNDYDFIHKQLWSMVKGQPYEHYENEVWRRWLKKGERSHDVPQVMGDIMAKMGGKG